MDVEAPLGLPLEYIVQHVFLPPKIILQQYATPQRDAALTKSFHDALQSFIPLLPEIDQQQWAVLPSMLSILLDDGNLGNPLRHFDQQLQDMEDGDVLALHITQQNAGLIVRRQLKAYSFESFELSALSSAVTGTIGRLVRRFPGPAIIVSEDVVLENKFQDSFTQCLMQLEEKGIPNVTSGNDSVDPRFVTEWLPGVLRGIGSPLGVTRIFKRTRDEVLCADSLDPWRRSPRWMLLRVALQTSLHDIDCSRYKLFMLYYMATLLDLASQHDDFPSDTLHVMLSKINRRTQKLKAIFDKVSWAAEALEFTRATMESAHGVITKRWNTAQKYLNPKQKFLLSEIKKLRPRANTVLQFPKLKKYLAEIHDMDVSQPDEVEFDRRCHPRIDALAESLPEPELLERSESDSELQLNLMDFELWVANSLNTWLSHHQTSRKSLVKLSNVTNWYLESSVPVYNGSPRGFSIMILTLMTLWVGLDKASVSHYPLLSKFDPGFPSDSPLFDSLLLPGKPQMEQLRDIEKYLEQRHSTTVLANPNIFTDVSSKSSFGAQFFDQSSELQSLKEHIESEALQEVVAKKRELREAKEMFSALVAQSNALSCTTVKKMHGRGVFRAEREEHDPKCAKCAKRKEAYSMKIECHEWPLPKSELAAKAVCFELDIPALIRAWRAFTYSLLVDVLTPSPPLPGKRTATILLEYRGLEQYRKSKPDRLQLASSIKPIFQTSQAFQLVSEATTETICLHSNLTFTMQDAKSQQGTNLFLGRYFIFERCTLKLPVGAYETLQYAINGTSHTSNEILSKQGSCADRLSTHEYQAFASLRSGNRLQWLNIARELASSGLDFGKEEVLLLILQTAWQAGPAALHQVSRDSHIELEEEAYGHNLLSTLQSGLTAVETNWQGSVAALVFISLASRLLSMSSHESVRSQCLQFLQRARTVTLEWLRVVLKLLHESSEEEDMAYLTLRTLDLALICHATFDIDSRQAFSLLSSNDNVAIYTEITATVRDRWPVSLEPLTIMTRELLRQFCRTSHVLEARLKERIMASPEGINRTMVQMWPGFKSNTPWHIVEAPNDRWVTNPALDRHGVSTGTIHFNTLTGELLINGLALGRLPSEYESSPTYQRLFGNKILEVLPSCENGMSFETRNLVHGYQVHFGFHARELIVRARRDEESYEMIPAEIFRGDIPDTLVQNNVHWLSRNTMAIEFRPLSDKWMPSFDNWRVSTPEDRKTSCLSLKDKLLVEPKSLTAKTIHKWLRPLETSSYINIFYSDDTKKTEICLPRMNLDFVLTKTELQSKQFRGMVVDINQNIGTLYGLENKLVLKDLAGPTRIVLVPSGKATLHKQDHHMQVLISAESGNKLGYHQFVVDKDLGRLVDNGNLHSRLFKLYLHALTSHCLPDPLTSRTGTEEALHGLRMASTRSFLSLDLDQVDILDLFAEISPAREYYPKDSKLMQTVKWADNHLASLSPLSQHEDFVYEARSMLEQAERLKPFQNGLDAKFKIKTRGATNLRNRALIRRAFHRVQSFGAEKFSTDFDVFYKDTRDAIANPAVERFSCNVAAMVQRWTTRLDPCRDLYTQIQKCGMPVNGPGQRFELEFSGQWLESPSQFLPQLWCSIHSRLSKCDREEDKYKLMIFLANLAYAESDNSHLVHTLLALATVRALRDIQPPLHACYDLSHGTKPDKNKLTAILQDCRVPFAESPEARLVKDRNENESDLQDRQRTAYIAATRHQISKCVEDMIDQWPTAEFVCPQTKDIVIYLPGLVSNMSKITPLFEHWWNNHEFKAYIKQIQHTLDSLPRPVPLPAIYSIPDQVDHYNVSCDYWTMNDLFKEAAEAPQFPLSNDEVSHLISTGDVPVVADEPSRLDSLLTRLSNSTSGTYQENYVEDLRKSHDALLADASPCQQLSKSPYGTLKDHLNQCKTNVDSMFRKICSRLVGSSHPTYECARYASMFPRLSPSILVCLLARHNSAELTNEWKVALNRYALAIADLQRAERLLACGTSDVDMLSELTNPGHTNWDAIDYPEWLLLELENNILIRPVQAQIACEMISPRSGSNSILQLLMGLGKTEVIVPIVAAFLADKSKLVRVVVLKSLSEHMFQVLVSKLGGFLGRRIYRLPIARAKITGTCAQVIQKTYEECMACGGILLVQPENILSFELLGIDHHLSPELDLAENGFTEAEDPSEDSGKFMIKTQQWLYRNARDILDESDEILSVKFELIYTLGLQQNIQFSPDRWCIIQHILGVLAEVAKDVSQEFPHGLEYTVVAAGAFPRVRILQDDAGKILLDKLAKSICRSGLTALPMHSFSDQECEAILEFVTNLNIAEDLVELLGTKVFQSEIIKMTLLLLRGLFAAGVLEFVLAKKRWRVNYGLDLSRSRLAVPYHAKDNPSARSEFSHPDTAIALTCLTYYYGGLTNEQIHACFEELFLSDHSKEDYAQWIQHAEHLPVSFNQLTSVNLRDKQQCSQQLFPCLRYSKGLIDYYLQHLVFPKELKEFQNKLSSSGWEIARDKTHPTTGFSGTNDSRYLLPTPIKQSELVEQLSTNAEMLECLLRPENTYDPKFATQSDSLDAAALLAMTVEMEPPVRVLLDVGAQLLEDNETIARSWLELEASDSVQAVIYFSGDQLFVLNREGLKEPLLVSPFVKQMDRCLVYLDEAHTRGTDLKMPANYRAIVTLGPDLTKDRLAQACKRLRKLGNGQSVVFCSPLEVQAKILQTCGKDDPDLINVEDVLLWAIHNSWDFTKKGIPLWATQGVRHYRRRAACDFTGEFPHVPLGILEPEALTLEERYGLGRLNTDDGIVVRNRIGVGNDIYKAELALIRSKCREFGLATLSGSNHHEEQERELQPENEKEQQVETPLPVRPYKHKLHSNIQQLVRTGQLTSDDHVAPAFRIFNDTRARHKFDIGEWPTNLLVTRDYELTVQVPNDGNRDSFLRPVNWILSFPSHNGETQYLIMSPFEVQELLPNIRGQDRVRLHVYSPRLSLSNPSFEHLAFCAVPPMTGPRIYPAVATTLNLFAGQLYLRSKDEYLALCRFLGIHFEGRLPGVEIGADGFITPETRHLQDTQTAVICKFPRSPIDFLRLITTFRRLGQSFSNSHMGKILSGELVKDSDFEKMVDDDREAERSLFVTPPPDEPMDRGSRVKQELV